MQKLRLILLFLLAGTLASQAQTLDEIIANHTKAIGGLEKWRSFSSVKKTGQSKFGNFEIPFTEVETKEGSTRNDLTIQGLSMVQVFDAKTESGWSINPFQGSKEPRKMNEEQTQGNRERGDMAGDLTCYKEKGWRVEYLGTDDIDGVEAHKLMLTKKSGSITYYYVDSQSWLIIKTSVKMKFEDKEVEGDTQYSDFQTIDGVTIPMSVDNISNGQMQGQTIYSKVEFNVEVKPEIFVMPDVKKPEEKKDK